MVPGEDSGTEPPVSQPGAEPSAGPSGERLAECAGAATADSEQPALPSLQESVPESPREPSDRLSEQSTEEPPNLQADPPQGPKPLPGEAPQSADASVVEQPAEEGQGQEPLGPPLIDNVDRLQRLHPTYPIWVDRSRGILVMVGRVCQQRTPLELFACQKGSKEHESVIVVEAKGYVLHAGLLYLGAEPGGPVQFLPEFVPPSGTEIEIELVWKDASGMVRRARAQDWVRDVGRIYRIFELVVPDAADEELDPRDQVVAWEQMEQPWVFAGSQFVKDEEAGRRYYVADVEGDLICVSNFPSAVLDVPIHSSDSNAALLFACYEERIPPIGTPVTLVLRPKLEANH